MTEIALLKFAHLLCFVYWLGGDLGVFYSSFSVVNEKLSPETRVNAAKILFALDQAPRICMTLTLATGTHLGYKVGWLAIPGSAVAVIWLICLAWLAMVLVLHFRGHNERLANVDFAFRVLMASFLLSVAAYGFLENKIIVAEWLAIKVAIFALLMISGLMVRVKLKPFGPAFGQLVQGNATDEVNQTIRSSLAAVRPFVIAIWIGLLINAALGLHLI